MPTGHFSVVYDGPSLADHTMPVRELAPALLALGDVFVETSLLQYPDQEPVALNVHATRDGSFLVDLALHSPDTWGQIVSLFDSGPVTALANIQSLVLGSGGVVGLIAFIKWLRGRRISDEQRVGPGQIRITTEDGATLEVPADVLELYRNLSVRRSVRRVVAPITQDGVERVAFVEDEKIIVSVDEHEIGAFDVPEPPDVPFPQTEREMVVEVVAPAFPEGNKWRLSDGQMSFYASLDDDRFMQRIESGEPFRKGDMLRTRMEIAQWRHGDTLHTDYRVVEVLEHIRRGTQLTLDDPPHEE